VDRVHGVLGRVAGPAGAAPDTLHGSIARGVYGGIGLGLRAASRGLAAMAACEVDERWDPRVDAAPRARFVHAAVNGLIGDRLLRERPQLAIPMAVRLDGRDVVPDRPGLSAAFPDATGKVVVFLHGLCENESHWARHRDRRGTTYADALAVDGWTPVLLRANTGLPLRENGVALAALLRDLVEAWPVPVERIALVGHSLGGLVMRAAAAVSHVTTPPTPPWTRLVTDVVTLGTPHLGAPLAGQVGTGSTLLGRFPESAAFGRILDWRSTGVLDLVEGLAEDVPPLPHARYRRGRHGRRVAAPPPRRVGGGRAGADPVGVRPGARGGPLPWCRPAARAPGGPLRPAQPSAGRRGARGLAGLIVGGGPGWPRCVGGFEAPVADSFLGRGACSTTSGWPRPCAPGWREIRCARTGVPSPWK